MSLPLEKESPNLSWHETDESFFEDLDPVLLAIGKKPVYSELVKPPAQLAQEKKYFFNALEKNEVYQPDLWPDVDVDEIEKNEAMLLALRAKIKDFQPQSAEDVAVRSAYRWIVNEEIANLRIALAANSGDMRRFDAYNRFIYGNPNTHLFRQEVETISLQAREISESENPAKEVAKQVMTLLNELDLPPSEEKDLAVDEEIFKSVKNSHLGYFALSLSGIDVPSKVKPEEGIQLVDQILENLGAKNEPYGYTVKPVEGNVASVNNSAREVRYPAGQTYDRKRFIALYPGHEVGRHVRETMNGYESGFGLLRHRMDRATRASEGKGVLSEQIVYD